MIRLINLSDNSETQVPMRDFHDTPLVNVWIEATDPTPEELGAIAEKTGIPADFLRLPESENLVNLRVEPEYGIVNFLIVKEIFAAKIFHPIVLAFSKDNLITVIGKEDQSKFKVVKDRMHKVRIDPPSLVAYYILDEIVEDHFIHLEEIEANTVSLEEEVLEETGKDILRKVFSLKANLVSFNKILWYERGLIFNLKNCSANWCPTRSRSLFDTTHEYLTRQIDIVETYREILSDAINAHLSTTSNKINTSIRRLTLVMFYLTIVTTLTSFPNTIATFFGISQFGSTHSVIIFVALIASIILPFIWLRNRKWLKAE